MAQIMRELMGLGTGKPRITGDAHESLTNNSLVGVEIEIEGAAELINNRIPDWDITHDGSLRDGGIELVLHKPLNGTKLHSALTAMHKAVRAVRQHSFSLRTSVHIHVDIRELTVKELTTFLYLYLIFEPLITSTLPKHRRDSQFCAKLGDSDYSLSGVGEVIHAAKAMTGPAPFRPKTFVNFGQFSKYSAANLASIKRFGSVEFRQLQGTSDPAVIIPWINIWLDLKSAAIAYADVNLHDILINFSAKEVTGVLRDIFNPTCVLHTTGTLAQRQELFVEGMRNAQHAELASLKPKVEKVRRPRPPDFLVDVDEVLEDNPE